GALGSMAMKAWPMRGRLPSSEKNESASGPIAEPVSAAQISSNMSASMAPFAPPMGKRLPCSMASFGSLVGLPSRSSAQPSGMRSPLRIAIMMRPRTTVVSARSMASGSPRPPDHLVDGPLHRHVGQAVVVVDQADAGTIGDQLRLGGAVGAAFAQHPAVERHARHAMRRQAVLFGVNQVARRRLGHAIICARALEGGGGDLQPRLRVLLHTA